MDEEDSEDVEATESIYAKNRKACEDKITFKVRSIGIDLIEDVSITGETVRLMWIRRQDMSARCRN